MRKTILSSIMLLTFSLFLISAEVGEAKNTTIQTKEINTEFKIDESIEQQMHIAMAKAKIASELEAVKQETQKQEDEWQLYTLTSYTAGYESTGKRPGDKGYGITASGKRVKEGRTIAADPKVLPLGTKVYIDGIGERVVEDTGSAIKKNKIDVYIADLDKALEFGVKRNVKVKILEMGD
ncbi:Cell wall-binding protein YocH precursor [compost metagenome]